MADLKQIKDQIVKEILELPEGAQVDLVNTLYAEIYNTHLAKVKAAKAVVTQAEIIFEKLLWKVA